VYADVFQIPPGVFVVVLFATLLAPSFIPKVEIAAVTVESTKEALAYVAVNRL